MIHSTSTALRGNFIQTIKTEQGLTEFSFLRKTTIMSDKYYVLALDKNLKAYWFSMELQDNSWKIIDAVKVPTWICGVEDSLSQAIVLQNLA
jgi:hypothetical protein